MGWFRRKDDESMDAQTLLAKAEALNPAAATPSGFRLSVEDVFTIKGRGTVVTGKVATGSVSVGSTVRLTRVDGSTRGVRITGIEMFRKRLDTATAGANVGLLLHDLGRADIGPGDVLAS